MADPRQDSYSAQPYWPVVFHIAAGADAADYDGRAWIAPFACEVIDVREQHQTLGTNGSAVTVMLKKVPSGTAKASGTDVLASGINLKATIDTVQSGTLHATVANRQLAENDSLALVTTGTLTAVDGVAVSVLVKIR